MQYYKLCLPFLLFLLFTGCGDDPVQPQPEPIPSSPQNMASDAVTPTSVALTWQTPAEGIAQPEKRSGNEVLTLTGYKLSYADTTITGIDKSATSYTVTGLVPQTNYTFSLKALNSQGEESVAAEFSIATPPLPDPAPPTAFTATAARFTEVDLAWTASTSASWSDFAGYVLSSNGQEIQLASTATTYTVSGLAPGMLHTFSLWARTSDGRTSIPVFVTATTEDNTPPLEPAANLRATTTGEAEIRLQWTASALNAENPSFNGYELTYTPEGTQAIIIDKDKTSQKIGGLTPGTIYTFSLRARSGTGKTSAPVSISWAPARISQVLRLYGSTSAMGAGVDLDGYNGAPLVSTLANAEEWDLAYDDRPLGFLAIGSPTQTMYADMNYKLPNGKFAKRTYVSSSRYNVSSLEEISESSELSAGTKDQLQIINSNQSFAFVVQTEEGNFAKVLVLARDGKVVQGTGNDTYIEIQIAYQPVPHVPYALVRSNGSTSKARLGATRQIHPSR